MFPIYEFSYSTQLHRSIVTAPLLAFFSFKIVSINELNDVCISQRYYNSCL